MMSHPRTYRRIPRHHPRGVVLVAAMWTMVALTAVILVLCREMNVEALVARQRLSQAKADAAEIGVEQFVLSVVEQELYSPGYKDQITAAYEQGELGDCYYWILAPYEDGLIMDDEMTTRYGLVDEASKLDINTATVAQIDQLLYNFTDVDGSLGSLGCAIVDYRDADDTVTTNQQTGAMGAESTDYAGAVDYYPKNAPFESTEELRTVLWMNDELWRGADTNGNGIIEPWEYDNAGTTGSFLSTYRGLQSYVTVYGVNATNPPASSTTTATTGTTATTNADGTPAPVDVNNTQSRQQLQEVLQQYLPGRAQDIVSRMSAGGGRGGTTTTYANIFDWAMKMQLNGNDFGMIYDYVTAKPPAARGGAATAATPARVAKVNINTAPLPVLMSLSPNLTEQEAQTIITTRQANATSVDPTQIPNIAWLLDVVPNLLTSTNAQNPGIGGLITGKSTCFSADIVTVTKDGRAFKRVRIVVDGSSGSPVIIHRKDLTSLGWPMDPQIRESLRNSDGLATSDSIVSGGESEEIK